MAREKGLPQLPPCAFSWCATNKSPGRMISRGISINPGLGEAATGTCMLWRRSFYYKLGAAGYGTLYAFLPMSCPQRKWRLLSLAGGKEHVTPGACFSG